MSINHDRALDKEMDEAAQRAAEVTGLEKNPLLIILYRLSHQDRQLESIRIDMDTMRREIVEHVAKSDDIKEAVDEMVSFWKGSRVVGRIVTWGVGVAAAFGAAYATAKKHLL